MNISYPLMRDSIYSTYKVNITFIVAKITSLIGQLDPISS